MQSPTKIHQIRDQLQIINSRVEELHPLPNMNQVLRAVARIAELLTALETELPRQNREKAN